jgi:hypothetical protein
VKIIVTGGRDYSDRKRVDAELTNLAPTHIIQGGATGADWLAARWGEHHCVRVTTMRADWDKHGRAAGPIRNEAMLREHKDATVLAFPGGRGTADCVRQARALGLRVIEVVDKVKPVSR